MHILSTNSFVLLHRKEDKIIHTGTNYQHLLDNPASQTFFLPPTDPEEIELLIKSLSSNKSTEQASIPTNILKMFKNWKLDWEIWSIYFFNVALSQISYKPRVLHLSLSCNNYRPISLLSKISKIIEKIVLKRLFFFLESNS